MEDVVMFGEEGKEDKDRICVSKVCNRLYDCEKYFVHLVVTG
jgi:hypothetical protein